ncbi:MAG TPA: phospholipid carrier-dependent glycosyltransferase [bacterium]|nr:phospholipid carrier-dependent glycosyltransferase [bacterium]
MIAPRIRFLAFGVLAATALRLWFSLAVHPPGNFLFSDMLVYQKHAERLRALSLGVWDTFSSAGYPVLLALVDPTGRHFAPIAVLQALMGGLICALAASIAWRLTSSRFVALAVFLANALYFPLIYYGGLVLTEVPAAFFTTLSFWILLSVDSPSDRRRLVLAGLSLSLLSVIRPNMVLLYAGVPAYFWAAFGRDRRAAWRALKPFILASLPLILAACVHNSILLRKPSGLASNGGLNFYLARAPVRIIHYQGDYGEYSIGPIPNMRRYGPERDVRTPVPLFDEGHFYKEGLKQIWAEPRLLLTSFDNIKEGLGLGLQDYWPVWKTPSGAAQKWLLAFSRAFTWVILLPAAGRIAVLGIQKKLWEDRGAPWLLTGLSIGVLLATFYFYLGDPRIHVPFDPVLIAFSFAAVAAVRLRAAKRTVQAEKRSAVAR